MTTKARTQSIHEVLSSRKTFGGALELTICQRACFSVEARRTRRVLNWLVRRIWLMRSTGTNEKNRSGKSQNRRNKPNSTCRAPTFAAMPDHDGTNAVPIGSTSIGRIRVRNVGQ